MSSERKLVSIYEYERILNEVIKEDTCLDEGMDSGIAGSSNESRIEENTRNEDTQGTNHTDTIDNSSNPEDFHYKLKAIAEKGEKDLNDMEFYLKYLIDNLPNSKLFNPGSNANSLPIEHSNQTLFLDCIKQFATIVSSQQRIGEELKKAPAREDIHDLIKKMEMCRDTKCPKVQELESIMADIKDMVAKLQSINSEVKQV